MDPAPTFAVTLKQRRIALDLTQRELARRVGCAVVTIQRLEQGTLRPSREFAGRLAATLELPAVAQAAFVQLARGVAGELATPTDADGELSTPWRCALPAALTPLIGRERDVAAVVARLDDPAVRVLTLLGPGGIGKTRLAQAVADHVAPRFADGALWVDLAPIREADRVPAALAQALGLTDLHGRALVPRLQAALRPKHRLLVLDNFEHVAAAPLVAALLAAAPCLTVLLTSRVVAGIYGEHRFLVPPLTLPDLGAPALRGRQGEVAAVRLFVERARAVQPAFALSETNAVAVNALCHRLDGLPLAIELAAARTRLLPPATLLARLTSESSGRLATLRGGPLTAPARHHTLRATLEWSYALLELHHQQLFRRLGVFVNGFRLEAVEAVCQDDHDGAAAVVDGVQTLLDSSLVQERVDDDGAARLSMLETLREYALEQLIASGEHARLQRRHAAYYLTVAEAGAPGTDAVSVGRWHDRLQAEHANMRAALTWMGSEGAPEEQVRLTLALGEYWCVRGHLREGRDWLAQAVARQGTAVASGLATPAQRVLHARALYQLGLCAHFQCDSGVARPLLEHSLLLFRQLETPAAVVDSLNVLAMVELQHRDVQRAHALLDESLTLAQSLGNADQVTDASGKCLVFLSILAYAEGDAAQVCALSTQILIRLRAVNDSWLLAGQLAHDAMAALDLGEYRRAASALAESVRMMQAMGERWSSVSTVEIVARLATVRAQQAVDPRPWARRAARLFGAAEALRETLGAPQLWFHQRSHEQGVAAMRALLDVPTLAAAWDEGRALSLEEVFAGALDAAECAERDG